MIELPSLEYYQSAARNKNTRFSHLLGVYSAGDYNHVTFDEIARQPWTLQSTANTMEGHADGLGEFIRRAKSEGRKVRLSGAGTSDYVGDSVKHPLGFSLGMDVEAVASTEQTSAPYAFDGPGRYMYIHLARSGNSPESEAVIMDAIERRPEDMHLVITCNGDGKLAGIGRSAGDNTRYSGAYTVVLPPETNDKGLAMINSFTSMNAACHSLPYAVRGDMGRYEEVVRNMAAGQERIMDQYGGDLESLASTLASKARSGHKPWLLCLGDTELLGIADESALKTRELTAGGLKTDSVDFLGARHGPIVAVDRDTTIFYLLSNHPYTRRYEKDLILQFSDRLADIGAETVVVCDRLPHELYDKVGVPIEYDPGGKKAIPPMAQGAVSVVPAQVLGTLTSVHLGINPDEPAGKGGIISRVVGEFPTYRYLGFERDGLFVPRTRE